ncbi:MAG: hypothetical protein RLO52_17060 [Sandaracinaceae bacterium]
MRPISLLLPTLLCLSAAPGFAVAHDSDLARWDVRADGDELRLELRTARAAIHQSVTAAFPEVARSSYSAAAYEERLRQLVSTAVRVEEDGAGLSPRQVTVRLGHESVVTMVFARRRPGPLARLLVDLRALSSRPNQHHLVFVHAADGRQRFMIRPPDERILRWSAGAGFVRASAGGGR